MRVAVDASYGVRIHRANRRVVVPDRHGGWVPILQHGWKVRRSSGSSSLTTSAGWYAASDI